MVGHFVALQLKEVSYKPHGGKDSFQCRWCWKTTKLLQNVTEETKGPLCTCISTHGICVKRASWTRSERTSKNVDKPLTTL